MNDAANPAAPTNRARTFRVSLTFRLFGDTVESTARRTIRASSADDAVAAAWRDVAAEHAGRTVYPIRDAVDFR